jgi:hypothetical protein
LISLNPGSGLACRAVQQRQGIADLGRLQFLDARDDVADLAGAQGIARHRLRGEHADLFAQVLSAVAIRQKPVLRAQRAVNHAHQHDHADVVVEPGVDDQGLERRRRIALGRRNARDDRFEDVLDAQAGLGRGEHRLGGIDADHVLDLLARIVRVAAGRSILFSTGTTSTPSSIAV